MATLRISGVAFPNGYDMRTITFEDVLTYDFYQATSGALRFFDDAANATSFFGRDLRYAFDGDTLAGVTGGTVTSITERLAGRDIITATGLSVSAEALANAVLQGNGGAVRALLTAGNDLIFGTGGGDTLLGNNGRDTLRGDAGNDVLFGGSGGDTLSGGAGSDRLNGGAGADDFLFVTGPRSGVDRIVDFARNVDDIVIDNAAFAGLGATGGLGGRYVEGPRARDAGDRIIYTQSTGELRFDADGNGSGQAVVFARVTAGTDLSVSDFWVV